MGEEFDGMVEEEMTKPPFHFDKAPAIRTVSGG